MSYYATGPYDPNQAQNEWEYKLTTGQKLTKYGMTAWEGLRIAVGMVFRGIWNFAWRWWK